MNNPVPQDYGVSYAPFWAKITGFDGAYFYSWVEQQVGTGATGPTMADLEGGRRGSTSSAPAWEPNCAALATGSYVMLTRAYLDPVLDWVYLALGGASTYSACESVSGSGSPMPDSCCDDGPYCISFTGIANAAADVCPCTDGTWDNVVVDDVGSTACVFLGIVSFCGMSFAVTLSTLPGQITVYVEVQGFQAHYVATYTSTAAWDCTSPLTLTSDDFYPNGSVCDWPATITVERCSGAPGPPTVDVDTTDLCSDETTLTITGTGFVSPATDNTVDLADSASTVVGCTVISGTSTSLVLSLDSPPISALGALTAVVTNGNGDSGAPTQVAEVINCGGGGTISRHSLGQAQSGLGDGGVSLGSLTFTQGRLYIAVIASVGGTGTGVNGAQVFTSQGNFTKAPTSAELGVLASLAGQLQIWYWEQTGSTTSGLTLTVDDASASGDAFLLEVVEVIGLVDNAPDLAVAGNNGLASAPEGNTSGTTATADEYVQAAFLTLGVGPPQSWQNGFDAGQNQSDTVSAVVASQLEGYEILSSVGTFQAALDQVRTAWCGLAVSFS